MERSRVGFRPGRAVEARDAYVTAFIRARRQGSLDGVLRSAEAFRSLDDRAVAEQRVNDPRERWAAATVAGS